MLEMKNYKAQMGLGKSAGIGLLVLHLFSLGLLAIIIKNAIRLEDLTDELSFYWIYHSHPINQLVHFFFIPTLVWTLMIVFVHANVTSFKLRNLPCIPSHNLNHATIWMILGAWMYTNLDPFGGVLYLPVMYLMYGSAVWLHEQDQKMNKYVSWTGTEMLFRGAIILHVLSWAAQIYSHAHFEHSRPALVDSFGQALTIAPLFAYYEGLWFAGIHTSLQQQVLNNVAFVTKDLCKAGVSMHVCQLGF